MEGKTLSLGRFLEEEDTLLRLRFFTE